MKKAINPLEKFSNISDYWSPGIVEKLNDYHLKIAKIKGEFVWHDHQETDELFLVLEGNMKILFRDGDVELKAGELFVVPAGVEHKPVADNECKILLIEPAGTVNTGNTKSGLTRDNPAWI